MFNLDIYFKNLNNYFRLHFSLSFRGYVHQGVKLSFYLIPVVLSQNITN